MSAAEGENNGSSGMAPEYEPGTPAILPDSEESLDERLQPYRDRLEVLVKGVDEMRKYYRARLVELANKFDPAALEAFVSMEEQKFALRLVAQYPCTKAHNHVLVQLNRLPVRGLLGANATCLPTCR